MIKSISDADYMIDQQESIFTKIPGCFYLDSHDVYFKLPVDLMYSPHAIKPCFENHNHCGQSQETPLA